MSGIPVQPILNLGNNNFALSNRVIAILSPDSSPVKRLREGAKASGRLVDITQGRACHSVVVIDSGHVILSSISAVTLKNRLFVPEK